MDLNSLKIYDLVFCKLTLGKKCHWLEKNVMIFDLH